MKVTRHLPLITSLSRHNDLVFLSVNLQKAPVVRTTATPYVSRVNRDRSECEYWCKCQRAHKDTQMSDWSRWSWCYLLCATEVLFSLTWRQKFRHRLWYDARLQGLYVGSAHLLALAYLWGPPSCEIYIWAAALQNKQNDLCAKRRLRSTRVSAITMSSWGPNVSSCVQRRLWSDWADVGLVVWRAMQ